MASKSTVSEPVTISVRPLARPAGWFAVRFGRGREGTAALHPDDLAELNIRDGDVSTPGLERAIAAARDRSAARREALRTVSRRSITAAALRTRLVAAGHAPEAAGAVVDALVRTGAICDQRFADSAAASARRAGRSEAEAMRRLRDRGVDEATARAAVERTRNDALGTDLETARMFAASRLRPSMRVLPPATRRRRLAGQLARRGHDEDTIRRVLDDLLGPEGA